MIMYKITSEFKAKLTECIGNIPYNQIKPLMDAIDVEEMPESKLRKIMETLGQLPYGMIVHFMNNVFFYLQEEVKEVR
jgi:hypothetical protein